MKHLTVGQHLWEYARKCLTLCTFCYAGPFLVSLFALGRKGMVWLMLGILGLFCLTWCFMLLRSVYFLWMIRRQERQGLPFETGPLQWLGTSYTSTWISENWLIHAGHIALHCSQIASVTFCHSNNTNIFRSAAHKVIVTAVNGRRYCWQLSKNGAQRIIRWHSTSRNN